MYGNGQTHVGAVEEVLETVDSSVRVPILTTTEHVARKEWFSFQKIIKRKISEYKVIRKIVVK